MSYIKNNPLNYITGFPMAVKSKGVIFSFCYGNILYEVTDDKISEKYLIDFGKKTIPNNLKDNTRANKDVIKNYAALIHNIKETDELLMFCYRMKLLNHWVFYDKKTKTAKVFNQIFDKKLELDLQKIDIHDGNDNYVFSEISAFMVNYLIDKLNKENIKDSELAKFYPKDYTDNPILIQYVLK